MRKLNRPQETHRQSHRYLLQNRLVAAQPQTITTCSAHRENLHNRRSKQPDTQKKKKNRIRNPRERLIRRGARTRDGYCTLMINKPNVFKYIQLSPPHYTRQQLNPSDGKCSFPNRTCYCQCDISLESTGRERGLPRTRQKTPNFANTAYVRRNSTHPHDSREKGGAP